MNSGSSKKLKEEKPACEFDLALSDDFELALSDDDQEEFEQKQASSFFYA